MRRKKWEKIVNQKNWNRENYFYVKTNLVSSDVTSIKPKAWVKF